MTGVPELTPDEPGSWRSRHRSLWLTEQQTERTRPASTPNGSEDVRHDHRHHPDRTRSPLRSSRGLRAGAGDRRAQPATAPGSLGPAIRPGRSLSGIERSRGDPAGARYFVDRVCRERRQSVTIGENPPRLLQ